MVTNHEFTNPSPKLLEGLEAFSPRSAEQESKANTKKQLKVHLL